MSRIDDLIRRLCPNGIEFTTLGQVVSNLDSQRRPVTRSDRRAGEFPYYGANGIQDYVDGYLFDGTFLLVGEDGSVVRRDGSPVLNWASGKIWVNNHAHVLAARTEAVELRYLYFYLQTVDVTPYVTSGSRPKLNQANLNRIPVPVPPIAVQREAARVLDLFTQLETELNAELETRRIQYAHYRDSLLTFAEVDGVRRIPMGELAVIGTGSRNTNEAVQNGAYPFFVRSQVPLAIDEYEYDEAAVITAGDGVGVGKVFHFVDGKYGLHQRAYRIHVTSDALLAKYLFYYIRNDFPRYLAKTSVHASVTSLRMPMFQKYLVPVPPLREQQRIVGILDKFEALVNDRGVGLPAELNARRKQYEHYRDRLLAFKELAA